MKAPRPVAAIADTAPYSVPRHGAPIDLWLAGNEGRRPPASLLSSLGEADPELIRRYPNRGALTRKLSVKLGVDESQLLITAGADDGLDRICRAMLCPGRNVVLPSPTFEMIGRYAEIAGGTIKAVPWEGQSYPREAVLAAIDEHTALISVVTPNNPTGAVATAEDITALSKAAPHAVILVDCAYVEFADDDLTPVALALPNAVVTRTLSKAYGLAGLRVGYAVSTPEIIDWLKRSGNPYSVSSTSLFLAAKQLEDTEGMAAYVAAVKRHRASLRTCLAEAGLPTPPSEANFLYVENDRASWLADAAAGFGIALRHWPDHPRLGRSVRITVPGEDEHAARLEHALRTALAPDAILFDMDGVLADVRESYRQAIIDTLESYGVRVGHGDIDAAKAEGDANNDWVLSQRMLAARGVTASLEEVTARFEARYQGDEAQPGLWRRETLMCERDLLLRLQARIPLAIVTGRPRADAERFLAQFQLEELFSVVVCMEDGPLKPDPAPVRSAMSQLNATRAWMIGDTPDDIVAARQAGVLPLGITGDPAALTASGAARVLHAVADLETLLP
ncbi:MAG: TIGR01548 family HAD-type hydrolase [Myxococcota bacterium]